MFLHQYIESFLRMVFLEVIMEINLADIMGIFNGGTSTTVLFYVGIVLALFIFRKKFEFQGIVALYRTKFGLKLMDKIAEKYPEQVKLFGLSGIGFGFVGMVAIVVLMVMSVFQIFAERVALDGSPLVLPGVKLAGTNGIVFPLVIGLLTLFIIIIVHEFSHGVVARAFKIPIKSSGIALFGPIFGAFVEPDEVEMNKKDDIAQYSVFSAGPFSNMILALVVWLALFYALVPLSVMVSAPAGVLLGVAPGFPAEASGMESGANIMYVDDVLVNNTEGFIDELSDLMPGETVTLSNGIDVYEINATTHPQDETKGYIGVSIINHRVGTVNYAYPTVLWFIELFNWVWFISFLVGLFNLLPIFMTDGARMLKTFFEKVYGENKEKGNRIWVNINKLFLMLFMLAFFVPVLFWLIGLLGL